MNGKGKAKMILAGTLSLMMCVSVFFCGNNLPVAAAENGGNEVSRIKEASKEMQVGKTSVGEDKSAKESETTKTDKTADKNNSSDSEKTSDKSGSSDEGKNSDNDKAANKDKSQNGDDAVKPENDAKTDNDKSEEKTAIEEKNESNDKKDAIEGEKTTNEKSEEQSKDKQAVKKAAAKTRAVHNDVITNITALLQDGSGPVGDVGEWQVFRLKADFELPNDTIHAGDTTVITLPDKLKFNQTASFEIKDSTGNVVANAVINGGAKTITLTYTDYTENHSDISGNFYFYVQIDRDQVDEEEIIPLEIDVSGKTVIGDPIHFTGIGTPEGHYLSKAGWQQGESNRAIRYQLSVNTKGEKMNNVTVTDKLASAGFTIDRSSIVIRKGNWVAVHGDWNLQNETVVTGDYNISWNDDGSFTINFGDIAAEDGFVIRYTAVAEYDLVDGEVIKNDATIRGDNISVHTASANATYYEAGGSAEGYVFKIKVKKQNPEGDALAGARFDVIRVSSGAKVGEIVTNAEGEGELGGLLKDEYKLVETEAPTGYVIDGSGEIIVLASDFDADKIAEKIVTNEKETINIPVTKKWVGPIPETETSPGVLMSLNRLVKNGENTEPIAVRVQLLADNKVVKEAILSVWNNWEVIFLNLPVYDSEDGHKIEYDVKEVDVPEGYEYEVTGDAENGFTVTNTNVEKISIPVEKQWVGPQAGPVTVKLSADGEIIKEESLSADSGWKTSFEDLPKYDKTDGHEIKYEIDEDDVEGYVKGISGTSADGFTITNTIAGKVSVPVTKVWEGPKKDFAEIELYADGKLADTVKLSPENNWQHTFTDLEKYNEGKEIAYTVKEKEITGYKSEITGDAAAGYTVKNVNVETRDVKVSKKWKGDPLDSITVRLYADGEEKESVNITKDMNWQYVFRDLPKYDKDGREIQYDVKEDTIQGYSSNISGDAETGFMITNEQKTVPPNEEKTTPKEKSNKVTKDTTKKTTSKKNDQAKSSAVKTKNTKTGDESELGKYFAAMILSGLAVVLLMMRRRKE